VKLQNGEADRVFDVREGLECPCMGLVEGEIEANPSGSGVRGGQREDVLTGGGLSAMAADLQSDRAGLPETGRFPPFP
jgi:hypothetical protein